jgi:hypothetical protein
MMGRMELFFETGARIVSLVSMFVLVDTPD